MTASIEPNINTPDLQAPPIEATIPIAHPAVPTDAVSDKPVGVPSIDEASPVANVAVDISSFEDVEPEAPAETCPQCHSTEPWGNSSWCLQCGYYPGISEICPQQFDDLAESDAAEGESSADSGPAPMVAPWLMKIIWYNTGLFVVCIAARYYFVFYDSSFRGFTGFFVLLAGFLTVAVNHLRASMDAMQHNAEISPFDMIGSPGEMWRSTISGLPKTAGRLIGATVGFSAMICGGLVIGGIDLSGVWAQEKPPAKKPDVLKKIVSTAVDNKPEENQPETIEEALEQVTTLEEIGEVPLPQPGEPVTCVVYGFLRDGKNDFGRILLAAEIGGKRRHVATMPASAFPQSSREILAARLEPLITDAPSVETQYRATWVRPTIGLRVMFSGWSVLGEMNDATLAPRARRSEPAPLEPNP